MSKYVTVGAIGAPMPDVSALPHNNFSAYEKAIKEVLKKRIEDLLPYSPDLIVFPECSNRPGIMTRSESRDFYLYLGDRFLEYMKGIALENGVNIAYSAYRVADKSDTPFRNSTVYIGRGAEICGIYDKNHLVIEKNTVTGAAYGREANVIDLDFGRVASVICYDLNFDELLYKYAPQSPDLIVFSSLFHGGLHRQAQWAYTCRSFFVGAVSGHPCYILNPYGGIIASSTIHMNFVAGRINLDYALCHIDHNKPKILEAKKKYKDALTVYDPGYVGSVMLSCETDEVTVKDIMKEFGIEALDDYFNRARAHREGNI